LVRTPLTARLAGARKITSPPIRRMPPSQEASTTTSARTPLAARSVEAMTTISPPIRCMPPLQGASTTTSARTPLTARLAGDRKTISLPIRRLPRSGGPIQRHRHELLLQRDRRRLGQQHHKQQRVCDHPRWGAQLCHDLGFCRRLPRQGQSPERVRLG